VNLDRWVGADLKHKTEASLRIWVRPAENEADAGSRRPTRRTVVGSLGHAA
jgi:hypothetical protein